MSVSTRAPMFGLSAAPGAATTGTATAQRALVAALVGGVVLLDQSTKWWAWRYASRAIINSGATWFIGRPLDGWISGPVTGALTDAVGLGALALTGVLLLRRRRRPLVVVAGALMAGGWGSNLLDRLGLHAWTAPGSRRGAVDFVRLGVPYFNLADFVIIGATLMFLVVLGTARSQGDILGPRTLAVSLHRRVPVQAWAVAACLLVAVVPMMTAARYSTVGAGGDMAIPRPRYAADLTLHREPVRTVRYAGLPPGAEPPDAP